MELSYIELDDRLDAVMAAELSAPAWAQRAFQKRYLMGWAFHELSLEGVILSAPDIERALEGRDGEHYCDSELLRRIRRFREATRRLKQASIKRDRITRNTLLEYQAILSGQPSKNPIRTEAGPTEQYKHEVVTPDQIEPALKVVLDRIHRSRLTAHPIQQAIEAHYALVRVWPFEEHSAAVARLVQNQILFSNGYPPALIHASDRQQYYHALHYDVSRLRGLVLEALRDQISFREQLFRAAPATLHERLAS
ncbi:MAG: Fic family protein [Myxococcales bacterium]|nr:Fic family protein [Myxococcales bacterium]MCB9519948.1 Fic family protein [Myxococcales bacterium]MCB9533144.1 Fic family protein [Myxococcales bacterium]